MDEQTVDQVLRREAVRRKLQGERTCDISQALNRTPQWVNKWYCHYCQNPDTDFSDQSRAPHTSSHQTSPEVEAAIVAIRKSLEKGNTAQTRYGLIGNRAVQAKLEALAFESIPSSATIQRVLAEHGLTHPVGANSDTAYYPWPVAWQVNAIHASDIITRHLYGGQAIENFHTIDHYSHAAALNQFPEATSLNACQHLLKTCAKLGLPCIQQFDNDSVFCGGHTHPRVIGRVVRLCLWCGIEVFFTPIYEAKRNYQIETFHSLWLAAFWSRHRFTNLGDIQHEQPLFSHWYHHEYRPPQLQGLTPAHMRAGASIIRLTQDLRRHLPDVMHDRLPITAGRFHLMRKVDASGQVEFLNEAWPIGKRWVGEYVWATVNTAQHTLTFWHKADEISDWRLLKTAAFSLKETIHDLLPQFRRNQKRCRDYLPA